LFIFVLPTGKDLRGQFFIWPEAWWPCYGYRGAKQTSREDCTTLHTGPWQWGRRCCH